MLEKMRIGALSWHGCIVVVSSITVLWRIEAKLGPLQLNHVLALNSPPWGLCDSLYTFAKGGLKPEF